MARRGGRRRRGDHRLVRLVGRTGADRHRQALAFASLAQVGIIFAEIGFGFRYVALIHILGHGCLRTVRFVRAPTLLLDYRVMENAIGDACRTRQAGLAGEILSLGDGTRIPGRGALGLRREAFSECFSLV